MFIYFSTFIAQRTPQQIPNFALLSLSLSFLAHIEEGRKNIFCTLFTYKITKTWAMMIYWYLYYSLEAVVGYIRTQPRIWNWKCFIFSRFINKLCGAVRSERCDIYRPMSKEIVLVVKVVVVVVANGDSGAPRNEILFPIEILKGVKNVTIYVFKQRATCLRSAHTFGSAADHDMHAFDIFTYIFLTNNNNNSVVGIEQMFPVVHLLRRKFSIAFKQRHTRYWTNMYMNMTLFDDLNELPYPLNGS